MKLNCYSIYDRKALQYHPPFFQSTDGAAVRSFADLVNDAQSTISRHPADYVLYKVGTYDDQVGLMEAASPLVHVIDAQSLVPIQKALPLELVGGADAAGGVPELHRSNGEAR